MMRLVKQVVPRSVRAPVRSSLDFAYAKVTRSWTAKSFVCDALDAWDGGSMSEDAEPVTTHEDAGNTAQGSLEGTAGPERTDTADNLKTE